VKNGLAWWYSSGNPKGAPCSASTIGSWTSAQYATRIRYPGWTTASTPSGMPSSSPPGLTISILWVGASTGVGVWTPVPVEHKAAGTHTQINQWVGSRGYQVIPTDRGVRARNGRHSDANTESHGRQILLECWTCLWGCNGSRRGAFFDPWRARDTPS